MKVHPLFVAPAALVLFGVGCRLDVDRDFEEAMDRFGTQMNRLGDHMEKLGDRMGDVFEAHGERLEKKFENWADDMERCFDSAFDEVRHVDRRRSQGMRGRQKVEREIKVLEQRVQHLDAQLKKVTVGMTPVLEKKARELSRRMGQLAAELHRKAESLRAADK